MQADLFGNGAAPTPTTRKKKPTDLSPEQKQALGEAAALIRKHLWLGSTPPPPPHPNDKPWSMSRDLNIWKRLTNGCGWTADEVNQAIPHVRDFINQDGQPLRLTVFYNSAGYATPLLEQCVSAHHKAQPDSTFGPGASVSLPPKIRDILRGMVGVFAIMAMGCAAPEWWSGCTITHRAPWQFSTYYADSRPVLFEDGQVSFYGSRKRGSGAAVNERPHHVIIIGGRITLSPECRVDG